MKDYTNKPILTMREIAFQCVVVVGGFVGIMAALVHAQPAAPLTAEASATAPTCPVKCIDVRISDGDTIHCQLALPFDVTLRAQSIRAYGYDAPEVSRRRRTVDVTEDELRRGQAAKAALEQLAASGELHADDSGERDPYGRISAWLWVRKGSEWVSVAAWMKSNGHVRN